jgi:glycosyltransferase involved in cell wall biosynthesis
LNILYLIDPNSIHDQKWISRFSKDPRNSCYFICRTEQYNSDRIMRFEKDFKIRFVGIVDYFSILRARRSIRQAILIKKIINEQQIHLFHIQYAEPNALWALFRKFFGIPILITCRGTDVLKTIPSHFDKKDIFNRLISFFYRRAFLNADWITVTSNSQLESVKKLSGRKEKTSIVRTGVDLKKLQEDTSSFFPKEITKPYILFPRYIRPIYNHEFAINSAKLLPLVLKRNFQMVFVGKDVGDVSYQNEIIKSLGEDKEINFIILEKQSQEGIWELYKRAELIIMTPKSDGSPVSGMEAIALHKKLILGPLNYDQDIFNSNTVFQLKEWDVSELKDLIEGILFDDSKGKLDDLSLIDFDANMEKVKTIYTQFQN